MTSWPHISGWEQLCLRAFPRGPDSQAETMRLVGNLSIVEKKWFHSGIDVIQHLYGDNAGELSRVKGCFPYHSMKKIRYRESLLTPNWRDGTWNCIDSSHFFQRSTRLVRS